MRNALRLFPALLLITASAGAEPPAAGTAEPAKINVRVYEGFPATDPEHGSGHPPFAIDVGTELTTCPDGNTAARSLDIGGATHTLDPPCGEDTSQSRIRVNAGSAQSGTDTAATGQPTSDMRCDPAAWRCKPRVP